VFDRTRRSYIHPVDRENTQRIRKSPHSAFAFLKLFQHNTTTPTTYANEKFDENRHSLPDSRWIFDLEHRSHRTIKMRMYAI
jgi:hypothetical protein